MNQNKVYTFLHNARSVEFGPHESEEVAKESFQARYGYWPDVLVNVRPYGIGKG